MNYDSEIIIHLIIGGGLPTLACLVFCGFHYAIYMYYNSVKKRRILRFLLYAIVLIIQICIVIFICNFVNECLLDLNNDCYITFTGEVEKIERPYSILKDGNDTVVEGFHYILPYGKSYCKIVYGEHTKVIVDCTVLYEITS